MGAYTTEEKVKALFRRIKILPDTGVEKTNTVITTEELAEFISEQETIIEARLSSCYDILNIGPKSKIIIGTIAKYKVASEIKRIMAMTTSNSHNVKQEMSDDWSNEAKMMLDKICPPTDCSSCIETPVMPLPDTPMLGKSPETSALFNSNKSTSVFKKGTPNW